MSHGGGFCGVIAYELKPFVIEPPPEAPWRWAIAVDSNAGRAYLAGVGRSQRIENPGRAEHRAGTGSL
jgi:hypothetical protein